MKTHYTTPHRVASELQLSEFSASTNPTKAQVELFIIQAEDYIDNRIGKTWRVKQYSTFLNFKGIYSNSMSKFYLPHTNILTLDNTKGDELQVWNGSTYDDYLSSKTEGRANDYYLDYTKGVLYINNSISYDENSVKITYRYSQGAETTLSADMLDTDTSLTASDLSNFEYSGLIRIDDEEILYSDRTSTTTLSNLERGANDTTASAHTSGAKIIQVPNDISEATTYLVCAKILKSEDRDVLLPEGTANIPISSKVQTYLQRAEDILSQYETSFLLK